MRSANQEKKDDQASIAPFPFYDLFPELQKCVLAMLHLEQLIRLNEVAKNLHLPSSKEENAALWRQEGAVHFPNEKKDMDSLQAFREVYREQYAKLSPKQKKLFSLVKTGRLSEIKKIDKTQLYNLIIEYKILLDANLFTLYYWAFVKGHQSILDYFYEEVLEPQYRGPIIISQGYVFSENKLFWAACSNQLAHAEALIAAGEEVNPRVYSDTRLPITIACINGFVEMCRLLISRGAKLQVRLDDCRSLLHEAARRGFVEELTLFLTHRLEPNGLELRTDFSALYYAAAAGNLAMVTDLVAHGAVVEGGVDGDKFQTPQPIDIAEKNGHQEIVKILNTKILEDYITRRGGAGKPEYMTSYRLTLFGKELIFNCGKSKTVAVDGAKQLLEVAKGRADQSTLTKHEEAFKGGELKIIRNRFKF